MKLLRTIISITFFVLIFIKANYALAVDSIECTVNGITGVNTALGCIPTNDMNSFAGWLLSKAILIAGGIAFILMSIGVFQITTSAGDPKKVQAGSELITSTLSGLLFIILSVFLLKLIGVDILHLPDFGQ